MTPTLVRFAAALAALPLGAAVGPAPTGEVAVAVSGLRSTRGLVQACLTRLSTAFPDCRSDPAARRLTVPAASAAAIRFTALPPGRYAVALLHDENGNGRADMALMVPREGFGFSRNPAARLGPPRFGKAAFAVALDPVNVTIRMRYLL
ncbi:MAG: DUF2141 domain-containing protein [Novosphingobium sp.]